CTKKETSKISKNDGSMGASTADDMGTPEKAPPVMAPAMAVEKPVEKPVPKPVEKPRVVEKPKVSIWDQPVAKLPKEMQDIFDTLKGRPFSKKFRRVDNEHYYKGNETRYDLWYKYIKDLGGAYVGVGPDQNYSFIGVSKPKIVVLMDYDIQVLATHKMYMLLTKKAKTPGDVYKWLGRKYRKQVAKWADEAYDKFWARWVKSIHSGAGEFVRKHHKQRLYAAKKKGHHYWLSDQAIFDVWKQLVEADRIKTVLGDLREGVTMTEIGKVLKQMNITVGVQYFSNAEEFWFYPDAFRKSNLAMPYTDKTMLIRSIVLGRKWAIGFKFHYCIQKGLDFWEWMRFPGKISSNSIAKLHRIPLEGTKYLSRLPGLPADAKQDPKTYLDKKVKKVNRGLKRNKDLKKKKKK
ncbi:hypothetical protein KKF84_13565, partial [Myxococcota bacterium]|nr:hypothetical protein [Myxococcota bacterium]MBU1536348.1 hypothetical protein [Myxococcota bacterium]